MLHWAAYGPINLAAQKGFWKDQGLDVEVTNKTSNQELNADLISGRIDVALDMMGSWVGIHLAGTPLKIIGETDWSYGGDQIIKKKTLDASTLKGQQVAIYLDQPSVTFFLGQYLQSLPQPLKLTDVKTVELETKSIADAFNSGTYQLSVNYLPQSAAQTSDTAQGEIVATSQSPGFEGVIPEGFVGRADIIAKTPKDSLKKLIKGWQTAVNYVYSDPDQRVINEAHWQEYATILRDHTFEHERDGAEPYTDAELRDFVKNVKLHSANQQLCINERAEGSKLKDSTAARPMPLRDYLSELKSFLTDANPTVADFTAEGTGILDSTATVEALKELGAVCNR